MNSDRLLELYEEISDASDAIARLRDVVLEVGVRGKLNEQDDAETVSPEFLNETSDPEFPANWRTLNFGKYCNIEGGNQPPKSQFVDTPRDGYVRLFQIRDLGERPVPVFIPETSTKRFSVEGEILIGRYGASVGKVFWAQNGAYNVALAKFIFPENAFLPDFAFRLLKSSFFQKALEGASRTAQAGFNKGDLAHIDFPLPPLAEQRRIVAKVDELMALCDQLEQARAGREAVRDRLTTASLARLTAPETDAQALPAEVGTALASGNATNTSTFQSHARFALQSLPTLTTRPDQIKTLRQTILNLAVRGKLVDQDPTDEPAAELLKRIAQEKAKGKKSAAELPKAESPEALGKIPSSWKVVPLIGIGSWAIGSGFPKNEQGIGDGPYFFLKVSDMNLEGNEKFITVSNNYIDDDAAQRMRAKIHPAGTIIFPKIGGAIATNKRRILTREAAIDNNCLGITFASEVNLDWAFLLMTSIDLTEYQVGTAVPALQQGVLEKIAVALPPLAEQHRIVAKVDALMTLCDQLEASLTTTATTRSKLLNALLHEALEPTAAGAPA